MANANTSNPTISPEINLEYLKEQWGHLIDLDSLDLLELEVDQLEGDDNPNCKIWIYTYRVDVTDWEEFQAEFGEEAEGLNHAYIVGSGESFVLHVSRSDCEESLWEGCFEPELACYVTDTRPSWF